MCHECPQDASIFVGQGNHGFLPATALSQGDGPLRDGIKLNRPNSRYGYNTVGTTLPICILSQIRGLGVWPRAKPVSPRNETSCSPQSAPWTTVLNSPLHPHPHRSSFASI